MKVKVEKGGSCRKILVVELPVEVADAEYAKVRDSFLRGARIPGFRQGKAPVSLVESRFTKEIREEVKERLVGSSYPEAVKQAQLKPLMIIDLQVEAAPKKPFTYRVTLDVPPDFKLPKYKNIAVPHKPPEVSEEDVQKAVNRFLERMATTETAGNRPAKQNDLVQVDYSRKNGGEQKGRSDGKASDALAAGKNFWLAIGAGDNFLPGFADAVAGMSVGEQKEISLKLPPDFKIAELAGKDVLYHVQVKAIRERKIPVMNDEFFKSVGVQSEAELRDKIKAAMLEEGASLEKRRQKQEIADYLVKRTDIDLPESIVQEEARYMFASIARERLMQGLSRAQLESQRDELMTNATKTAGDRVKLGYILHKIGDEEKISVEENEVEAEIQNMAHRYRVHPDELKKELEEKKEIDSIRHELRMEKILDFLLGNSVPEEKGIITRLFGKKEEVKSAVS